MRVRPSSSPSLTVSGVGYGPEGDFSVEHHRVDPRGHQHLRRLLEAGALCNNARLESRQLARPRLATEGACAGARGTGGAPRRSLPALPAHRRGGFHSDRKRVSVISEDSSGRFWSFVEGSPEDHPCPLLGRVGGRRHLLWRPMRLLQQSRGLGKAGNRVLAMAFRALVVRGRAGSGGSPNLDWPRWMMDPSPGAQGDHGAPGRGHPDCDGHRRPEVDGCGSP